MPALDPGPTLASRRAVGRAPGCSRAFANQMKMRQPHLGTLSNDVKIPGKKTRSRRPWQGSTMTTGRHSTAHTWNLVNIEFGLENPPWRCTGEQSLSRHPRFKTRSINLLVHMDIVHSHQSSNGGCFGMVALGGGGVREKGGGEMVHSPHNHFLVIVECLTGGKIFTIVKRVQRFQWGEEGAKRVLAPRSLKPCVSFWVKRNEENGGLFAGRRRRSHLSRQPRQSVGLSTAQKR